jgi:hypothetical protein
MKLIELFESTNEDRAIISLASAIASYLNKYNFDPTDRNDPEHYQPINIGTIGNTFDTPMWALEPVKLQVMSDDGIHEFVKKYPNVVIDDTTDVPGLWAPHLNTIILNSDFIGSKSFEETITHELRHALDDYKSDFKASKSGKYNTARDKAHRKVTNDPYMGNLAYSARPSEINSRFTELLNKMVGVIDASFKNAPNPNPEKLRSYVMRQFMKLFAESRIPEIYPKGEDSPEYRRLIRRAEDFIEKEISYRESNKK